MHALPEQDFQSYGNSRSGESHHQTQGFMQNYYLRLQQCLPCRAMSQNGDRTSGLTACYPKLKPKRHVALIVTNMCQPLHHCTGLLTIGRTNYQSQPHTTLDRRRMKLHTSTLEKGLKFQSWKLYRHGTHVENVGTARTGEIKQKHPRVKFTQGVTM